MKTINELLLLKIDNSVDINSLVDKVIDDKDLKERIIERTLVEQYVTNFYNNLNKEKLYSEKLIVEINEQIKTAILIGKSDDKIYKILAKSKDKIEAILTVINKLSSLSEHEMIIMDHIKSIRFNLSKKDIELEEEIKKEMSTWTNSKLNLSFEDKKKLIEDAIDILKKHDEKITYIAIAKITGKHQRTIKNYMKLLKKKELLND